MEEGLEVSSPPIAAPARVALAVALLGLSTAWNGGNVGPVAAQIADKFDVSLAVVGLLSGTFFLGSVIVGLLFAAELAERTGIARGARLACAVTALGNLLFALSPLFVGLAAGRVLTGLAFALANTVGAVWALNAGGLRLLGVFGASIQLGIGLALLLGSGLSDAGVDWRVGFLVSAALAAAGVAAVPSYGDGTSLARRRQPGFLRAAASHARAYRLALLFIAIYGVPLTLSAWLVEYLAREGDATTTAAGVASFLLFGLSAATRLLGAQMQQRGLPHRLLGGALGLAAIGLAAIAFEPAIAVAFAAVVVLAVGFGIPYATALSEAQALYPSAPTEPVALMTLAALIPPAIVIPLFGHALSRGDGEIVVWGLAVFVALATVANLRRTGIPLTE